MALALGMEVTASEDTLETAMKKGCRCFCHSSKQHCMQPLNAWQTCLTCMRVANMANLTTSFFCVHVGCCSQLLQLFTQVFGDL